MASKSPAVEVEVDDRVVRVSNPDRVYFPARGETKLDLVDYYLSVRDGIVNALFERPCMLHRFPTGVSGEKVHQKRLPAGAPPWMETVRVHFPRWNRTADELCVTEIAHVVWAVQMSTVEFHPWNSRRADTEKPDEWRIDLDPGDACDFATVRRVAHVVHEVLDELGATGFPKTSGGKGMHVYVRIPPEHGFKDVRRAALAFAREVERRTDDVTTTWWRKDRDPKKLFVDYNQNARDHTIAAAYSVRGNPEGTVSTPIRWDEVDDVHPRDFTIATVPARYAEIGDLHAGIDREVFDIRPLLDVGRAGRARGCGDAPRARGLRPSQRSSTATAASRTGTSVTSRRRSSTADASWIAASSPARCRCQPSPSASSRCRSCRRRCTASGSATRRQTVSGTRTASSCRVRSSAVSRTPRAPGSRSRRRRSRPRRRTGCPASPTC